MRSEKLSQVSIGEAIDAAIGALIEQGEEPRGIHLVSTDYARLAAEETAWWQEQSGSSAKVWPCSYDGVPLISESLLPEFLPVRQATYTDHRRSAVYAKSGTSVAIGIAVELSTNPATGTAAGPR